MSGIFPFINGDDGIPNNSYANLPVYKECAWDFVNDKAIFVDGSPKIVYKNEAIKVWVYRCIKTNRYQHEIYTWDYGSEIESLIGKGFEVGYIKSETERYIREAILINPYILEIEDLEVNFKDSTLLVSGNVKTIYGNLYIDI